KQSSSHSRTRLPPTTRCATHFSPWHRLSGFYVTGTKASGNVELQGESISRQSGEALLLFRGHVEDQRPRIFFGKLVLTRFPSPNQLLTVPSAKAACDRGGLLWRPRLTRFVAGAALLSFVK